MGQLILKVPHLQDKDKTSSQMLILVNICKFATGLIK